MAKTRLAYLQVGPPTHGICRYGRLLAAEGRRRAELEITEENIDLSGQGGAERARLRALARDLSARADLVHVQVSVWGEGTWGGGWDGPANLLAFCRASSVPVVVTLHDAYPLLQPRYRGPFYTALTATVETGRGLLRPLVRALKRLIRGDRPGPDVFANLWNYERLSQRAFADVALIGAAKTLVLLEAEKRLFARHGPAKVESIPHFVEDAERPDVVRTQHTPKTVIIAGFIAPSKGHPLLIEALTLLPDVRAEFVGGPGLAASSRLNYDFIMDLAREMGVDDRITVTGYLEDALFARRLAAADLAVCAFEPNKSASGSLATLIAAGVPMIASNAPAVAELNALEPDSILFFSPYTPAALAAGIKSALAVPREALTARLQRLRERLSMAAIYDLHLQAYERARRP